MLNYKLNVLGLDVSFTTETPEERVRQVVAVLEERYGELESRGRRVAKEKLLTFLALSLADDLLECEQRLQLLNNKLKGLVSKIDDATE